MSKIIRYKVVKNTFGRLFSVRARRDNGNPVFEYKLGQMQRALPNTGIFVFNTLENARNWKDPEEQIYECECFSKVEMKRGICAAYVYDLIKHALFLRKKHKKIDYGDILHRVTWPNGTEHYKSIKLLNLVE